MQENTGQGTGPVWCSCGWPGQLWARGLWPRWRLELTVVPVVPGGSQAGLAGSLWGCSCCPALSSGLPCWWPHPEHGHLGSQPGEGLCVLRHQRPLLCPRCRCGSLSCGPKAGVSWVLVPPRDPREDNGEALPHPRQEPTPPPRRPAPAMLPVPSQYGRGLNGVRPMGNEPRVRNTEEELQGEKNTRTATT